jgi:hypothetical protein
MKLKGSIKMKNKNLIVWMSLLVFLSACDSQKQTISAQAVYEKVDNVAWLREKLPAQTLAYFRIPTIWGLFFGEKGDVLQPLQKLQAHKSQINQIRQGFVKTYNQMMPQPAQLPFKTLLTSMTTPLEIAIINASDGSMVPSGLIATTLNNYSIKELNDLFAMVEQQSGSQFKILQAFDDKGQGRFMAAMMPVFVSFDVKTGRLLMLTGITASVKQLHTIADSTEHSAELDPIFAFENSVDEAGKNIEMWLNIAAIYKQNQGMIPPNEMPMIKKMGIDKVQYLWAGTAAKNGKSEFILQLGMPDVGIRQFIPRVNSHMDVATAGVPRSIWQLTIPSVEQVKQAYKFANSFNPNADELTQTLMEKIIQINDYLGVSLEDVYKVYGQKLLIVTDDSGTWFATKILDQSAHNKILDQLSKAFKARASVKQLAGVNINESIYTTKELEKVILGKSFNSGSPLDQLNFYQHSYYQVEGDYLLQAFTPQVLADRANSGNKQALNTWLQKQKQNWDTAIFAHTQEIKDAPRDIYHSYLNVLAMIGNFAEVEVDLFAFPTAKQLHLPETGSYGFSLDSSTEALTLKLSYEYVVIENMSFMDSYFTLAYLGVVMAYAIPAYRDYTVRAKIAEKMFSVDAEKLVIAEYYLENKAFPNTEFISEKINLTDDLLYNPKNGSITIYYTEKDGTGLTGMSLTEKPIIISDELIEWHCSSDTIPQQQLPKRCN